MHTVAVIVQDGFTPFEFGVACEAFGLDRTDDGIPAFDFRIVTPDPGPVRSSLDFTMNVDNDLSFADDADLVVVTTIPRATWGSVDPRATAAIERAVARGAWVLSVCSGSFVVAASGVLDGKKATTHWIYADAMTAMYPNIDVDPDALYVQDGRIITSAGTAAGLDACLHLLRQELGAEMTNRIARRMVIAPQRDGGQAQFIDRPIPVAPSQSFSAVTEWMLQNLREELTVDELARKAKMSPRSFARHFKLDLGTTPAAWLARQRLLHAQRLLERTELGLEQVAWESGFGSAAVLRQNFLRRLSVTPTAYRAKFSCVTNSHSTADGDHLASAGAA